jgi:hypothetical protein
MDSNLNDPNLPIAEYIRRCQERVERIDRSIQELMHEKGRLIHLVSAYGSLQDLQPSGGMRVIYSDGQEKMGESFLRRHVLGASPNAAERSRHEQTLARVAILLSAGRKKTGELIELLGHMGYELPGSNPTALLSTLMSKDERFVSSRKHGWGLAGRDNEDTEEEW